MPGSRLVASLPSALLARKGQARPAMRTQDGGEASSVPAVLAEREALDEALADTARTMRSVSLATATRLARKSAAQVGKTGRAAFTLRLDGDRHLRLRLASALTGSSAQQLVTYAVDEMLNTLPEVELLVEQLPPMRHAGR